jgi:hypothetical protein
MNKTALKTIADQYRAAEHEPLHESWDALRLGLDVQFRALERAGVVVVLSAEEPYANLAELRYDIARNGLLLVYTGGQNFAAGHPLAAPSPFRAACGTALTWNEIFRAVHDYYGQYLAQLTFEPADEVRAYLAHAGQFRELGLIRALAALRGETVGQVAVYATYGEFDGEQKARVLR